jgi:hypothetical protein
MFSSDAPSRGVIAARTGGAREMDGSKQKGKAHPTSEGLFQHLLRIGTKLSKSTTRIACSTENLRHAWHVVPGGNVQFTHVKGRAYE